LSDWISFDHWPDCALIEQPGFVFEVQNEQGQSLLTTCTVPLQLPFDWKSAPVQFRLLEAPRPRHSNAIAKPEA
jgi:hypothetical protein